MDDDTIPGTSKKTPDGRHPLTAKIDFNQLSKRTHGRQDLNTDDTRTESEDSNHIDGSGLLVRPKTPALALGHAFHWSKPQMPKQDFQGGYRKVIVPLEQHANPAEASADRGEVASGPNAFQFY